jgi:hypothetical protein
MVVATKSDRLHLLVRIVIMEVLEFIYRQVLGDSSYVRIPFVDSSACIGAGNTG